MNMPTLSPIPSDLCESVTFKRRLKHQKASFQPILYGWTPFSDLILWCVSQTFTVCHVKRDYNLLCNRVSHIKHPGSKHKYLLGFFLTRREMSFDQTQCSVWTKDGQKAHRVGGIKDLMLAVMRRQPWQWFINTIWEDKEEKQQGTQAITL